MQNKRRYRMPQIQGNYTEDFMSFLRKEGVSCRKEVSNIYKLYPVQSEINQEKVKYFCEKFMSGENINPIFVAQEGHILDGHHRYYGLKAMYKKKITHPKNHTIPVYRIGMKIENIIELAKKFKKVKYKKLGEDTLKEWPYVMYDKGDKVFDIELERYQTFEDLAPYLIKLFLKGEKTKAITWPNADPVHLKTKSDKEDFYNNLITDITAQNTFKKAWGIPFPKKYRDFERLLLRAQKKLNESAPPGNAYEKWILARKAEFKKKYGDEWASYLYGKAWDMYNDGVEPSMNEARDTSFDYNKQTNRGGFKDTSPRKCINLKVSKQWSGQMKTEFLDFMSKFEKDTNLMVSTENPKRRKVDDLIQHMKMFMKNDWNDVFKMENNYNKYCGEE